MILKPADDKEKRLKLLQDLQLSSTLNFRQKKWLREESSRFQKGIQGERESAFYLDSYFKNNENYVVIHDLRFVHDGDVAQIDHLVINRGIGIYLIETKNYSGNLLINERGEFTVEYDEDRFGIPSPLEQSHRHERVLKRLLERLEIGGRTGASLDCYHLVMLHPKAKIERPPTKAFDTSNVIKADQFPTWHGKFVEKKFGLTDALKMAVNFRSRDTIKEWGDKLIRQHRPASLIDLPEFMQPGQAQTAQAVKSDLPGHRQPVDTPEKPALITTGEPVKTLICRSCNAKISFAEGKFCWNNAARFGGLQYCREHQSGF